MTEEAIKFNKKKRERRGENETKAVSPKTHTKSPTTSHHEHPQHEHPHQNFGHTVLHRGRSRTPTQPRHRNSHYARAHHKNQHQTKGHQPCGHNGITPSPTNQANPTKCITITNPTSTPNPTSQAPKEAKTRMPGRGKGHSPYRPGGMA